MDDTRSASPLVTSPSATTHTTATSYWTRDSEFVDAALSAKPWEGSESPDATEDHARKIILPAQSRSQSPESPPLPPDYTEEIASPIQAQSLSPIAGTLSDKLRELAATAWTLEQDDSLTAAQQRKVNGILRTLTDVLRDDNGAEAEVQGVNGNDSKEEEDEDEEQEEEEYVDKLDLDHIYDSLRKTLQGMRDRREEQRHLHKLAIAKLEAVAQQCITQDHKIADLARAAQDLNLYNQTLHGERDSLRAENHTLGSENDDLRLRNEELRHQLAHLQSEAQKKTNALSAMGSAVAGLEGWIDSNNNNDHDHVYPNSAPRLRQHQSTINPRTPSKQPGRRPNPATTRTIVRGTGRFRGRYQVDVDDWGDEPSQQHNSRRRQQQHHQHDQRQQDIPDLHTFNGYDNDHDPQNFIDNHDDIQDGTHDATMTNTAADLQDDVRAWIRGCRDVLEYVSADTEIDPPANLSQPHPKLEPDRIIREGSANDIKREGNEGDGTNYIDEEWGDFQNPQRVS